MAQRTIVTLTDDIEAADGREVEATHQIRFAYEGQLYDIDLSEKNADEYHAFMSRYVKAGRRAGHIPSREDTLKPGRSDKANRTVRPMTEAAGNGATYSRHQGGIDPAKARAFAIKHGLIPEGQRGRLAGKYKEAYSEYAKFGTTFKLNELKAELKAQDDTSAPATLRPATDPALQAASAAENTAKEQKPPLADPVTEFADAIAGETLADLQEAEAAKHYKPLTLRSPEMEDDKKWARRTAYGCLRTDKVKDMTLTERINAVGGSNRNLTILGMLAGIIPLRNGQVSHLNGSAQRLQNLEMIQYAPESEHGWEITDFGRFAYQLHSMGE